jgi:hypothetical protein
MTWRTFFKVAGYHQGLNAGEKRSRFCESVLFSELIMLDNTNSTGAHEVPAAESANQISLAPAERCDVCGSEMRPMGHCKYLCLLCGFLMTCHDLF